jgi:alkanesulfonate monooxygenase SsuD/methylene tetrahydromethanopterin reductase-like flavin-dependent oxidoreductase (luciferase family)
VASWNAWFTWFGNSPEGYRPMRERIDEACRSAGRDPDEVERTLALLVAFPDAVGRRQIGDLTRPDHEPIPGEPEILAETLRRFAAEGVGHVQLVLDPITPESVGALGRAVALLDA